MAIAGQRFGVKTGAVFEELLAELRAQEARLLTHPDTGSDEQSASTSTLRSTRRVVTA